MIAYRFVSIPGHLTVGTIEAPRAAPRPAMFFTPPQAKAVEDARLTVAKIQRVVAEYYGLAIEHMASVSRDRKHAWPRQMAMLLCHDLLTISLPNLGNRFGNRHHTTVLHAIRATRERISSDVTTEAQYSILRSRLGA